MQQILSFVLSIILILSSSLPGLLSGEKTPEDFIEEVKMEFVEKVSDNFGISKKVFSVFFEENTSYRHAKKTIKQLDGIIVGFNSFLNEYKVYFEKEIVDLQNFCDELKNNERIIFAVPQIVVNAKECFCEDDETSVYGIKETNGNDFDLIDVIDVDLTEEDETEYDFIPNDPFDDDNIWNEQYPAGKNWHLEAIEALSAWQYLDRMSEIEIGIVDSGFDTGHEDLQGKIDFPNSYLERTSSYSNHGTHVAGIISANMNNEIGVCGVCPKAKLHCVDWEPLENSISQLWIDAERIYTGLIFTVKEGAKAVNFSLGSDMKGVITKYPNFIIDIVGGFSSAIISVLLKHGYDFIVCQAAGNGNDNGYAINAENNLTFCAISEKNCVSRLFGVDKNEVLDRIIVVGSATTNGNGYYQPSYSNVGDRVDICAPGDFVFSTINMSDGAYSYMSGTSMATPVVTGVCGLVWSIDSSFTGSDVKKIICSPDTSCNVVKATLSQKFDVVDYKDYPLINAKLSVEKAIEISESR